MMKGADIVKVLISAHQIWASFKIQCQFILWPHLNKMPTKIIPKILLQQRSCFGYCEPCTGKDGYVSCTLCKGQVSLKLLIAFYAGKLNSSVKTLVLKSRRAAQLDNQSVKFHAEPIHQQKIQLNNLKKRNLTRTVFGLKIGSKYIIDSVFFLTIFRQLQANTCRNSELEQNFGWVRWKNCWVRSRFCPS